MRLGCGFFAMPGNGWDEEGEERIGDPGGQELAFLSQFRLF